MTVVRPEAYRTQPCRVAPFLPLRLVLRDYPKLQHESDLHRPIVLRRVIDDASVPENATERSGIGRPRSTPVATHWFNGREWKFRNCHEGTIDTGHISAISRRPEEPHSGCTGQSVLSG